MISMFPRKLCSTALSQRCNGFSLVISLNLMRVIMITISSYFSQNVRQGKLENFA